ncbi:hypothetical protein LINPERPRIM_LOCUS7504 [Linum perenne]
MPPLPHPQRSVPKLLGTTRRKKS